MQIIGKSEPIPVHQADLQEIERGKKKLNREVSKEDKQLFYSELLGYCKKHGKREGYAAHSYRKRFGVWPNALEKTLREPTDGTYGYIKHLQIANAKRNAA
jgi:hypothetical protein